MVVRKVEDGLAVGGTAGHVNRTCLGIGSHGGGEAAGGATAFDCGGRGERRPGVAAIVGARSDAGINGGGLGSRRSGNDGASGLAVDSAGAAYITGYNQSANFPGQTSIPFTFQAFVVKLAANGSLAYSYQPTAAQISDWESGRAGLPYDVDIALRVGGDGCRGGAFERVYGGKLRGGGGGEAG